MSTLGPVSYVTDLEGQWERLLGTIARDTLVSLEGERLVLQEGAIFVFGGDAVDRGPSSRRILRLLLDAKSRYGDRVVLLAGNRDLNKLRLATELTGAPPANAPDDVRGDRAALLRFLFQRTMGAPDAFAFRAEELAAEGLDPSDEGVVASFLDDVAPDGLLSRYLARAQLGFRHGPTLFVHGGLGRESYGRVPGRADRLEDVDDFVAGLNGFLAARIEAFRGRGRAVPAELPWQDLVDYQAPVPGLHENPRSVVYGRLSDAYNNPSLPPDEVVAALARRGVRRLVVGHSPSGDLPAFVRADEFELLVADTSRGRVASGASVRIDGEQVITRGRTILDDGSELEVQSRVDIGTWSPIGRRRIADGRLIKALLDDGAELTYRGLPRYVIEQLRLPRSGRDGLRAPTREPT